jgi:hypothetical protein
MGGMQNMFFIVPFSRQFFRKKDIDAERNDRMFLTLTFVACGGVLVALLAGVSYITPLLLR